MSVVTRVRHFKSERRPSKALSVSEAFADLSRAARREASRARDVRIEQNHAALVTQPQAEPNDSLDSLDLSIFAARHETEAFLDPADMEALHKMIDRAGVRRLLFGLVSVLETRVEDGVFVGGQLMLHLSQDNIYARIADRLLGIASSQDVRELNDGP